MTISAPQGGLASAAHDLGVGDAELGRLVLEHPDADAAGDQPGGRRAGELDDVRPAGVDGEQHPAVLARDRGRLPTLLAHVSSSFVPAGDAAGAVSSSVSSPSRSRGPLLHRSTDVVLLRRPGVAPQPQEELHVASRAGQRAGHHPRRPPAERRGGPGDLEDGVGAVPAVADHSPGPEPLAAHLELRLDHRQQVGVRAARRPMSAGSTSRSEMKDRSATTRSTGPSIASGRQGADVGALVHPDPLVGAQGPGELAVADVDGDDLGGAAAAAAPR